MKVFRFFLRQGNIELPESADADSEGKRWEFGVFESHEVKLYFNFSHVVML